jgi:xylulose-5-phosphate/fructose-6-phosphate phosphoketolase
MPAGEIDIPNPPALPSHLPDNVLELAVQLEKKPLPDDVRQGLVDFQRAACYIAAGETHFLLLSAADRVTDSLF